MPKYNHVMLDLETLSTRADACIIQIAAIAFDIETGELGPRFNAHVNETSLVGARIGHIDLNTVAWWLKQKHAPVMGAALTGVDSALPLGAALLDFEEWFVALAGEHAEAGDPAVAELCMWSHGATFDIPILTAAFTRAECDPVPWSYRAARDTRTLFAVTPGGMPVVDKDEARAHDALYDCEIQIAQVVAAWGALHAAKRAASEALGCVETQRTGEPDPNYADA